MSLNTIDNIEKISILFKLIQQYFKSSSIEFNIKLAIDLSLALDYVKYNNISDITVKSEYSQQLNKLLNIISQYFPKILQDLNKTDIKYNNNYLTSDKIYNNKDINVIQCNNEYNEIDYVVNYIISNINQNISIICVNDKILRLLKIRLDFENIKYNNNSQYNKNYYEISPIIKNKVEYYFNNINKEDIFKITKLLSFLDITETNDKNITICDFKHLNSIQNSDVVFCLSMNNETWQLQNNLWLSNMHYKHNINNIFNYILNNSKKLYCLYSLIVNGKTAIKSSILNKLEVDNNCNLLFNNYDVYINNINNSNNNTIVLPKISNNLIVLNGSDIRNLIYDRELFYYNNVLGLKQRNKDDEDGIYTLFKKIFYNYYNDNYKKLYDDILNNTAKIDSLYLKKFRQIIYWLNTNTNIINNNFDYILNNNLLETNINNNIIIKTHCDRIEINNNTINIKKYSLNKISKSSILSGKESNVLTQALILQQNKMINEISEINLEIWNPNWQDDIPITINKFTLPVINIENHLNNITNALTTYQDNFEIDNNNSVIPY